MVIKVGSIIKKGKGTRVNKHTKPGPGNSRIPHISIRISISAGISVLVPVLVFVQVLALVLAFAFVLVLVLALALVLSNGCRLAADPSRVWDA